jgi:hypothetical protein
MLAVVAVAHFLVRLVQVGLEVAEQAQILLAQQEFRALRQPVVEVVVDLTELLQVVLVVLAS